MGEDKSKVLHITEDYLNQLISYTGKSLVGKILKRFEILDDKDAIKKAAKELVYEEYRQLRDLIIAYDKGLEINIFKFNKTGKNLTEKE